MKILFVLALLLPGFACGNRTSHAQKKAEPGGVRPVSLTAPAGKAIAAFAEGCFWCVEEIFEAVPGVDSVISGYAGGTTPQPTYEAVSRGATDHAESVLVYYNPAVVPYEELVRVFFASHDPTTPNRQGPDVGRQYRSVLFYQNAEEKSMAERAKAALERAKTFSGPIVTEIAPLTAFYRAEAYHQDYIRHHPDNPYVIQVSIPRFEQFKRTYPGKLKSEAAH